MTRKWKLVYVAALSGVCAVALTACMYGPNTLRIVIAKEAILPPMVGHWVYCGLWDSQALPGEEEIGQAQVELTTTEEAKTIPILTVQDGGDHWQGVPGTEYVLEVWVDLNDNYPFLSNAAGSGIDVPESGIDYVTSPARLTLVLGSDFLGTEVTIAEFVRAP
jgi:hypothetical protein